MPGGRNTEQGRIALFDRKGPPIRPGTQQRGCKDLVRRGRRPVTCRLQQCPVRIGPEDAAAGRPDSLGRRLGGDFKHLCRLELIADRPHDMSDQTFALLAARQRRLPVPLSGYIPADPAGAAPRAVGIENRSGRGFETSQPPVRPAHPDIDHGNGLDDLERGQARLRRQRIDKFRCRPANQVFRRISQHARGRDKDETAVPVGFPAEIPADFDDFLVALARFAERPAESEFQRRVAAKDERRLPRNDRQDSKVEGHPFGIAAIGRQVVNGHRDRHGDSGTDCRAEIGVKRMAGFKPQHFRQAGSGAIGDDDGTVIAKISRRPRIEAKTAIAGEQRANRLLTLFSLGSAVTKQRQHRSP